MSILIARVSYFGSQGFGDETVLSDWNRIVVKRGLDSKSNTFNITLKNGLKKRLSDGSSLHRYVNDSKVLSLDNDVELAQGDVIKLWLRWADSASDIISYTDSSAHLITVSEIQEWEGLLEEGKTWLLLKCVDKTYEVLNKLWASAYPNSLGLTCPTMIQNVIRNATDGISGIGYNDAGVLVNNGTFGVDARIMTGTYVQQAALAGAATGDPPAYIEGLRINESAYPTISMSKVWKPVYEWAKEINDIRNTNRAAEITNNTVVQDRNNVFYIDQNNRYHQFYPADTVDYTLEAGVVDDDGTVSDYKLTKKTFDIINMVIYNAGKDLDGVGILWYYFDRTSKERRLKMKYIPMLEIGSEGNGSLRQAEVDEGNISIAADGVVTILNSSGTTSWGKAYATEAAYKTEFREYAKGRGSERAEALTRNRGNPRWKGNASLKRGAHYAAGQLCQFTSFVHGLNKQNLRIKDVTHMITPSNWSSQLEVEEDERKYGES